MDRLSFGLLDLITRDEITYRGLLAIPYFARMINPSRRIDFMIKFGYTVKITNEDTRWYKNGKLHRLDGPAVECAKYKQWYINDKRHRLGGPAVECANYKAWYINGKQHRLDGPAAEDANYKAWYKNGKYHRLDGPAIEFANGDKKWFINGIRLTEEEFSKLKL